MAEPTRPTDTVGTLAAGLAGGGPRDEPGGTLDRDSMQGIFRTLRWRVFFVLAAAILAVFATGALLLLAPMEYALIGIPALLVAEFVLGFVLSGKLLALALARHHERLRDDLVRQQDETRRSLVERWRSLDAADRDRLRERFPDVDWGAIDALVGTGPGPGTKH
ncbi:MAG: hypothetical protein HY907_02805 [Deltaproteobacteria bacterium]|nr:hypothetical protein [Deltaproteobacteria bacterium]